MKIEITYTKKDGVQISLIDVPKSMDSVEVASIIEDAITELKGMQSDFMPSMDHN